MFCGEDTLIGIGPHDVAAKPLACKRWLCSECLPMRLSQLKSLAQAGDPTTFITFTCRPSRYESKAQAAADLVRLWRNVRQRLTREGRADKIPFLAVIEATKAGWPHLHVLCRAPYIPQRWLSAAAGYYIGAPIVDIRRVNNRRGAARYVAKYISKGPERYDGCKRYWRSQDYAPGHTTHAPVQDACRTWFRERENIDYIRWTLEKCDWNHRLEGLNTLLFSPGSEARWLWADHDPPPKLEVQPCRTSLLKFGL